MIKRMTQLVWAKKALERIGTPKSSYLHMSPTRECIERGYEAALRAFATDLPIERLYPSMRLTSEPAPGTSRYGDLPAAVCLDLGRYWSAQHTSLSINFESDDRAVAHAYEGYLPKERWQAPFNVALWSRIELWLRRELLAPAGRKRPMRPARPQVTR